MKFLFFLLFIPYFIQAQQATPSAGRISQHVKYLASDRMKGHFLFIAFGAEELGLQGSRHFVNKPTLPLEQINFMTHMDMIE